MIAVSLELSDEPIFSISNLYTPFSNLFSTV